MKRFLQLFTIMFAVFAFQNGYTQQAQVAQDQNCCPADHPCEDEKCNDCWQKYCHYEPCYYTTKRCVEEKIPCKKKCTRMVTQNYEVKKCRMVPEYYTEQACRQVPECYEVDDCKIVKKVVSDQHCKYVPKYYWKRICAEQECKAVCPK